jgi:acyl carrier protein
MALPDETTEAIVLRVVHDHLKEAQITKSLSLFSTLDEAGLDSIGRLSVLAELAEVLRVDLEDAMQVEGVADIHSLQDLVKIAEKWRELH